jgi:ankyrin repeat protein
MIPVESVAIELPKILPEDGESAMSCACQNGHDEALEALFELGACVNETALPAAIRSGSFRCVERLLERKVEVNSTTLELATACDHADVLGRDEVPEVLFERGVCVNETALPAPTQ